MRRAPALAAAALVLLACRDKNQLSAADSAYAATIAELRALPTGSPGDSAARAAILLRRGTTAAALEERARKLADDPARAVAIWSEIERLVASRTAAPPTPSAPSRPLPPAPRNARPAPNQ